MNDDLIRGQFEYWAAPQGLRLHRRDVAGSARLGQYCEDDTQLAFEAFRAALSHAAGQEGDTFAKAYGELARAVGRAGFHINCDRGTMTLTPAQPPASAGVDVIDRAIEPIAWKLESTIRVPVGVRPSDISDHPLAPPEVTVYETRYRWRADFFAITNEAESAPESYVLRSILPRDDAASSGRKGGDI